MDTENPVPSFPELVRIADCLLEESGEDEDALVRRLETLPGAVRRELLVSDLLNAWQVFYYFFRTCRTNWCGNASNLNLHHRLLTGWKLMRLSC